jgi:hypothetical protein
MYTYIHIHMYNIYICNIYICICIHIYTCTQTHTHRHTHTHTHTHSVAGGVVCEVLAVSDWRISSATEGSHHRRAPRAPAPRHAVVNKYLLRSSKIIYYTVVQKSLLLGLYDGGHAWWAGRASEMFHARQQ